MPSPGLKIGDWDWRLMLFIRATVVVDYLSIAQDLEQYGVTYFEVRGSCTGGRLGHPARA